MRTTSNGYCIERVWLANCMELKVMLARTSPFRSNVLITLTVMNEATGEIHPLGSAWQEDRNNRVRATVVCICDPQLKTSLFAGVTSDDIELSLPVPTHIDWPVRVAICTLVDLGVLL